LKIPIAYISGKFRHYLPDGKLDHPKMEAEVKAEQRWAGIVARSGCAWFGPLANTHFLQATIPDDEFIRRDLEIIRCLRLGIDVLLMRPGWKTSEGAQRELAEAQERGLEVVYGIQGEEVVAEYLAAKAEGRDLELEDALDVAEAERRLANGKPLIPYEEVRERLDL